ncbi:helix-turn-helix domain-containing protein [Salinimicrobium xinjiangense]|uniref:helix-turn-helix domain-containing protein n=1 Tax=Salinimicrobium xinjiangense TaxID=438596 RepID=UPI0004071A80|nr:helix-turn-helix domain-containing protein [Salinimicrobium xinjiangense]
MIELFSEEIDLEVPAKLRGLVLAFILGETGKIIQERIPMYPTGLPLLVNLFGSIPLVTVNGKKIQITSRILLTGQICGAEIHSYFDGFYKQLGIVLYPSAPYYLFHKGGEDLINNLTPFGEISPINSAMLNKNLTVEKLSKTERLGKLVDHLELLEENRLPRIEWLEESLSQIFKENGKIDQKDLLENSGVGSRHFRRIFKKVIGVSPKYFCKVIQMNTAFEAINNSDPVELHHIALDCGYYDQSHFINDFRNMFGSSPEKFLNGKHAYIKNFMGRRGT